MGAPGHGYVGVPAFHIATSQEAAAAGEFGFCLVAEKPFIFGRLAENSL